MISIDTSDLTKKVNNFADYTAGFFGAVEQQRPTYHRLLGAAVVGLLYEYIDTKASMDPASLHHMYEPDRVGDPEARLFTFTFSVDERGVSFGTEFRESRVPMDSGHVFRDKARVMELGQRVTIRPVGDGPLVFDDDNETFFVHGAVTVDDPGGAFVAGSFVDTVNNFFESYLTLAVVAPAMRRLADLSEYRRDMSLGFKYGRSAGYAAGVRFLSRGNYESVQF